MNKLIITGNRTSRLTKAPSPPTAAPGQDERWRVVVDAEAFTAAADGPDVFDATTLTASIEIRAADALGAAIWADPDDHEDAEAVAAVMLLLALLEIVVHQRKPTDVYGPSGDGKLMEIDLGPFHYSPKRKASPER